MPLRAAAIGFALLVPFTVLPLGLSLREGLSAAQAGAAPVSDPAANPAFYTSRVQPILQANCYRCHAGLNHRGGLQLDSKAGMTKGGHDGAVIVPGHPEQSLLVKLIRHEGPPNDPMPMPPKSKLSDADIATVEQWVRAGAVMPPDSGTN
jgi:cytochrome c